MSDINDLNIRQSFFTWLQSSDLANDFKTGNPDKFDPNREDTQEWVWITVSNLSRKKTSQAGHEMYSLTVTAEVKSRDQDAALGAAALAGKVRDTLWDARIPVYDYSTSGDPQVGLITLNEAEARDEGGKVWTTLRISITGVAQNLT